MWQLCPTTPGPPGSSSSSGSATRTSTALGTGNGATYWSHNCTQHIIDRQLHMERRLNSAHLHITERMTAHLSHCACAIINRSVHIPWLRIVLGMQMHTTTAVCSGGVQCCRRATLEQLAGYKRVINYMRKVRLPADMILFGGLVGTMHPRTLRLA